MIRRQREIAQMKRERSRMILLYAVFGGLLMFSAYKQEQGVEESRKAREREEQELRDSGAPEWFIEDRRFDLEGR